MDNYLSHFNFDPEIKSRLNHFRYQYLLKVSNIFPEDAELFEQHISCWSSPCKGDYHRFYHLNPLLSSIENALAVPGQDVLLLSKGQDILLVPKSDLMREWIVEQGLTPTLQQAASTAAHLSLYQENTTHQFPEQNPSELSFSDCVRNPIFAEFKALADSCFSASVLVGLIEGFAHMDLDEKFKEKGVHVLLQDSYGRILRFLEQALRLDLSQYLNLPKFEAHLDLAHEELLLWLMVAEPYSEADLERGIRKTIVPPQFLKTVGTGMAAFSEILKVVLEPERTILLFDGCYFENRASLLKSYPSDSFYVVRFPDYAASLEQNLQRLREENKTIDVLFINFHENILKGRYINRENNVGDVIAAIVQGRCASSSLTVVIDQTIGFLNSTEIQDLLDRFPTLHIVVLWSHQKFDLLGFDKISGGSYAVYSQDEAFLQRFRSSGCESLDFLSRQGLAHYFASVPSKLEERRQRIFSNALYVNSKIKADERFVVVVKEDAQNFSVDVQCATDLDDCARDAFIKRGIPLMIRSGFGFNLTTIAFTRFNMLRFSIGIEEQRFLDEFIAAFNDIFIVLRLK